MLHSHELHGSWSHEMYCPTAAVFSSAMHLTLVDVNGAHVVALVSAGATFHNGRLVGRFASAA